MANKTTITNLINSNLADSSTILASEHRAVEIALLDAIYPTPLVDTHLTTNVLTSILPAVEYQLTFTKVGRMVHVNGFIENTSGSILSLETFANITNVEFNPFSDFVIQGHNAFGNTLNIQIESGMMSINSTFGASTSFFINQSYPVIN
jgi:hypothetical protein